jgi:putative nucleotidyltransferase with HDIG domain
MIELLNWFQINYPELKKALHESHHNFDDSESNPYHIEGDCWSHTMLVCKIAELRGYDRVVQVSALLHDIGKPQSRKINPENNHVNFYGHEELSAKMAEPMVANLVKRKILTLDEANEVLELIAIHSYLYKEDDPEKIYEKFKNKPKLFKHLVELSTCDDLGRFSEGMGASTLDKESILRRIEENSI